METKKRCIFSAEEKAALKDAVLQRKNLLENKKSDAVSLVEKNKAWEDLTTAFNSRPNCNKRTTGQLRKAWENLKFRRKVELGEEKRQRMKTGGGSYTPNIAADPELDSIGVDIEMREDAIDSDVIYMSNAMYEVVEGQLLPINEETVTMSQEPRASTSGDVFHTGSPIQTDNEESGSTSHQEPSNVSRRTAVNGCEKIDFYRKQRNDQFLQHDREIHLIKIQEHQLNLDMLKEQRIRDKEMHEKRMGVLQMEMEERAEKKSLLQMEREERIEKKRLLQMQIEELDEKKDRKKKKHGK